MAALVSLCLCACRDAYYWLGAKSQVRLCNCDCGCVCGCADVTDAECQRCRDMWAWFKTGDPIEWRGWAADEPRGVFGCAVFTRNQWLTANCDDPIRYVCERGTHVQRWHFLPIHYSQRRV